MNKLSLEDRAKIIRLLVEGTSLRACTRIADVSYNAVKKLLVDVGQACLKFHNEKVVNLQSKRVQVDEIWSFVFCKDRQVEFCTKKDQQHVGDTWTWVGIDADSKLVISWLVGDRDIQCANAFVRDVAARLKNRVQLSSDGYKAYITAVERAFPGHEVDYAQIIKVFGFVAENDNHDRRYSPSTVTRIEKKIISGFPDDKHISTSYIERQNLTMRMSMRRFTRLTNAFSKKIENHKHAIAIHYAYYNFCRVHKTLKVTPAMEAKIIDRPMTIEDIVRMAYADEIEAEKRRLARMYK